MSKADNAVSLFRDGYNVSQALLAVFCPELGIEEETALKLGAGLGGRTKYGDDACGVVTGGIMVIGLRFGNTDAEDNASIERTSGTIEEFVAEFEVRNGSTICGEILGIDVSTEEGLESAERQCLITDVCPNLLRDGAEILEMVLTEKES